jgi:hypothetical protein
MERQKVPNSLKILFIDPPKMHLFRSAVQGSNIAPTARLR